jgi:hypothetical protein
MGQARGILRTEPGYLTSAAAHASWFSVPLRCYRLPVMALGLVSRPHSSYGAIPTLLDGTRSGRAPSPQSAASHPPTWSSPGDVTIEGCR